MLEIRKLVIVFLVFCSLTVQAEIIEKIKVVGNVRISTQSIMYRIQSQEGEELDLDKISKDIMRLWNLKVFSDIKVDLEDGKKGKIVIFAVKERPIVKEYEFLGNHVVGPNALLDKLHEKGIVLRRNTQLDYEQIAKIKKAIIDIYKEKGYQYTKVEHAYSSVGNNIINLTFTIYEGSKVHVYKIDFEGNKVFPDKKLKRKMKKLKEHGWFSWISATDIYSEKKYNEAIENLKKFYWKHGYKDVYVGQPKIEIKDFTSEKQKKKNIERLKEHKRVKQDLRMYITIPIHEGKQYFIGKVSFIGNKLLPDTYLVKKWELEEGEPYNLEKINEFIKDISETYNNFGYLQFTMEKITKIRDGNIVDLTFKFNEGKRFVLNRLEFKGNDVTRDKVLRREFLIPEGSIFRIDVFKNSMLKINQLGFFDITKKQPDIKIIPGENKVDVVIQGEESGVNELNFGGGYSEFSGFFLQGSYTTRNFLGRGEQLSVSGTFGRRITYYNIMFSEPWIFDYPHSFTVNLYNSESEYFNFSRKASGFSVSFGFRLTTFLTYSIGYKYELVDVPGSSLQQNSIFKPIANRLTSSIFQAITFNTLNHPFMPTEGQKYSLSFEYAGWQLGGDNFKYSVGLKATKLIRVYKKTFVDFNITAYYQKGLEGNVIPYYDRYFIGGTNTVRGYDYRRISPLDPDTKQLIGGTKMFVANFEYVIPVENRFQFAIFYDVGGVWTEDMGWFSSDYKLKRSWGFEARFNLPVFQMPMRVIYGFPLDEIQGVEKQGNLEFTIGTIF